MRLCQRIIIVVALLPGAHAATQDAPDRSAKLLALAEKRFGEGLTDADRKLFRATANGGPAIYGDGKLPPEELDPDRILKADCIRWLCTDPEAAGEVLLHVGVWVQGARIEERLRLSNARLEFPLSLQQCSIEKGIVLDRAQLFALFLNGTHSGPIRADGLVVEHDLLMRGGFEATAEVRLVGAKIAGDLDCTNGRFSGPKANGYALNADRIEVGGGVFLRAEPKEGEIRRFEADGGVRLFGAKIAGSVWCDGGHFTNTKPGGYALYAAGIEVDGSVFLRSGFQGCGEVNLLGARVAGNLECDGGHFRNSDGYALDASAIEVGGGVYLRRERKDGEARRFEAEGGVRLLGAKIGGDLDCADSRFSDPKPDGYALNADRIEVKGNVFLRNGFQAEGTVNFTAAEVGRYFQWQGVHKPKKCTLLDLESARIGTLWDEDKSWPQKLALDGLVYDRLYRATLTSAESPVEDNIRRRIDDWIRRKDHEQYLPQPYEQLAKVLDEMGHDEQARKVLIAKENDPARLEAMTLAQRMLHKVLGATIGYGYRPWQAAGWILGFWVLGSVLFGCAARKEGLEKVREGTCTKFNALVYSLDAFAPLIDLHQAKYRLPTWWWLRTYLWIHIMCGWLLTTLLVVGLTGLVHG